MMTDPAELLRALNPEPVASAPPIDRLWRRLEADALMPGSAVPPRVRRSRRGGVLATRLLVAGLLAVAVAIGVGAVVVLPTSHRAPARPTAAQLALPSPARGLVGILGVLRRPQTPAERDLGRSLTGVKHIRAGIPVSSLIRVATVTPDGEKVILVPMRPRNGGTWSPVPGSRASRSTTTRGLRLAVFADGAVCCSTPAAIEAGQTWLSYGSSSGNYVVIVVPDGVARVSVAFAPTVTAPVHDNVAVLSVPRAVENLGIYRMAWYGPAGTIVKRIRSSLPSSAQSARARTRLIRQDEQSTARIAPQIAAHFPLFGAAHATGVFGRGPGRFTVSEPALASLPTAVLEMGAGGGYPMDVKATREITTLFSGLSLWVQAGRIICMTSVPPERIGACSGSPALARSSGMIARAVLPDGQAIIIGIVPGTNRTITVITAGGATRVVSVTDGVFITPAHGVARIQVEGITGKTLNVTFHPLSG
jgi:hypothetical protein